MELSVKSSIKIASLRTFDGRRYGSHGETLRAKLKAVGIHFNVECVSYNVDQLTHILGPAGSMINESQVTKEMVERISSSTVAGAARQKCLRARWCVCHTLAGVAEWQSPRTRRTLAN